MQDTDVSDMDSEGMVVDVVEKVAGSHNSCPLLGAASLAQAPVV